jgi:electron transfer flavoprotein alpha subunit
MAVLVIAEHDHETMAPATRHTIAAAARLGGDVHILVVGENCRSAAEQAAAIAGVAKVRVSNAPHYGNQTAENLAALITSIGDGYTHILAPSSSFGKNVMPRVAASLNVAQISDVIAIEAPDTFVRPIYSGSALAVVRSTDAVKILTVRTTAFEPAGPGGSAELELLDAGPDLGFVRLVGKELTQSERPDLTGARVVVAGGRGLSSQENFHELLEPLADRLGGAVGATRAAVDSGFISNDFQIGQTGKVVAPELYIAVGISGAIQHTAGSADSKVIVAINKDADAPIFQIADYGLVADLFEAVPQLISALD